LINEIPVWYDIEILINEDAIIGTLNSKADEIIT